MRTRDARFAPAEPLFTGHSGFVRSGSVIPIAPGDATPAPRLLFGSAL